jgi:S1-C subfamily serine protease
MSWIPLARAGILAVMALYPTLEQTPPQKSTADLVDLVRPAVVQVVVKITLPSFNRTIPPPLDQLFLNRPVFVVGTGFFVNAAGDVVTASHVANGLQVPGRPPELGVQQIIQILKANGIDAIAAIGVSIPNVETSRLKVESGTLLFPATLTATDADHDIAVFHATVNPFTNMPKTFGGPGAVGLPQTKAGFVHLATKRPRDAEEIFACGFPFGEPGLVTTSGTIASAWKSETLLTARASSGIPNPTEVYWADLRVNPGNSGGPIFRMRDHAVLGIVVENEGNLGFVVPAKYVADFLKAHGIQWNPADKP